MAMRGSHAAGYSGRGYDRWSYEQSSASSAASSSAYHAGNSALNKLQHKYWITRQKVARKLGKDEDEHVVASDAELDAKLELFGCVKDTTSRLQLLIELYQERLCNLSYEENAMGRFLKEQGKLDKTKAGKMMTAVGKAMSHSGQQRLAVRVPLVRLYQEVDTFRERAILDTAQTVESMEKVRTEYRAALMWMKKVSSELDPDTYKQLEKFRQVQSHVKQSKSLFDKLKLDCLQKIDLLAASRCNMFSHALILYQNALITFWQKTASVMEQVDQSFKGYQYFEFSYIKELAEPSKQLAETLHKQQKAAADGPSNASKASQGDLFQLDQENGGTSSEQGVDALDLIKASEDSLNNLLQLKEEEEDDTILLEIDSQLSHRKDANADGPSYAHAHMPIAEADEQLLQDLLGESPHPGSFDLDALVQNTDLGATASSNEDDFAQFVSASEDTNLSSLLPSNLFDLDHSLYSKQSSRAGPHDLLGDFPMPSPAKPSSVEMMASKMSKEETRKMALRSDWFGLFADLDPLANPDAITASTSKTDQNCYS